MRLVCVTPILGELSTKGVYEGMHIPIMAANGKLNIQVVVWNDKKTWFLYPLENFKPLSEDRDAIEQTDNQPKLDV